METEKPVLPGEEPERIQRYIALLCNDLENAFPDKVIDPAIWQHDRWDKPTALLCRELGYRTGEDFLTAYGYTVLSAAEAEPDKDVSEYSGDEPEISPTAVAADSSLSKTTEEKMQDLLNDFANAEVSSDTATDLTVKKPAPDKDFLERLKEKKEYTPSQLFEVTFGGVEDEPDDRAGTISEPDEDSTDHSGVRIKLSKKLQGKAFGAVFAGILILVILAVFMRVIIDKHEAKVQAAQAAAEAIENSTTYVDTGSFTVSVTLPADYTEDPELTQKEYNALAEEQGYNKILLNADDSLTYIMSRSRQYQMRSEVSAEVIAFFDGITGSAAYPEISTVEPDSDYTTVKVTVNGTDVPTHMAALAVDMAYYCGKYQRVNGSSLPSLTITIFNNAGEKIDTYKPTCP